MQDRRRIRRLWRPVDAKGVAKFVKDQEAKNPGSGEKILADLKTKGWTTVNKKKYGVYPWKKPFGTPTGKIEIYGFKSFAKPGYDQIKPISDYAPAPAYTAPKPRSNEFVLVSGKNCTSSSGLNIFAATTRFTGRPHPVDEPVRRRAPRHRRQGKGHGRRR